MAETLHKSFKLDLASRKNWDALLVARGTSEEMRKIAATLEVVIVYTLTGEELTIKMSAVGTDRESTQSYTLGQEKEITTPYGYKVKSTWVRDGKKLIETQRGEKMTCTVMHDFSTAGQVDVTSTVGDVTATHIYRAI